MDGYGNLFGEAIINQLRSSADDGDNNLVFLDADTPAKQGGFDIKKDWVEGKKKEHNLDFSYFIYPDNSEDGDVECLMEDIACRDRHRTWFDCFEDYEKCVIGIKDAEGHRLYNVPNLKGKLHTYISSMNLSNKLRSKLGNGDWLFENEEFWNLSSDSLKPLLTFLEKNLQ